VRRVFVDSSGFFALLCAEDAHHQAARTLFAAADTEHWRLVTTNAVAYETHALILARLRDGRRRALAFIESLEKTSVSVQRVRPVDESRALGMLRAHRDKDYSLCDALSFAVMERLRIAEAIAFDKHFRQYGRARVL
jgi:uncharacterized protein